MDSREKWRNVDMKGARKKKAEEWEVKKWVIMEMQKILLHGVWGYRGQKITFIKMDNGEKEKERGRRIWWTEGKEEWEKLKCKSRCGFSEFLKRGEACRSRSV